MSKYLYNPKDIAIFFDYSDFKLSDENKIKEDIWENRESLLAPQYRKDKNKFINEISKYMVILSLTKYKKELDEINKIFKELGNEYEMTLLEEEEYYVETFFKFIKLRLIYTENCKFVRLKLRTLLKNFGYKRRSENLVNNIKRTMRELNLNCFIKDYKICDINEVDLDDTLIIRFMDLITLENAEKIKHILLNNCIENKSINLEFKYLKAKTKINAVGITERSETFTDIYMEEMYFLNDEIEENKLCLDINNKEHMIYMNIGDWGYDYRIPNMHIVLGSTYNFGASKTFFSQLEISQALEDDNNIYTVKNISKLAGEGAISRINSGLKDDKEKKFERRNRLAKRLNADIMYYDNYEWLIISKINKKDLKNENKYNEIYYNLIKDIIDYSLTIEDIICEDKIKK